MLGVLLKRRERLGSVDDDLGRSFPLHDRTGLEKKLRETDELDAFARGVRAEFPRSAARLGWSTLIAIGVMILSVALIPVSDALGWDLLNRVLAVAVVVLVGAVFGLSFLTVAWIARHMGPAKTRALRRVGRCLACTYDLRELDPGDDGLTVCPECGAAWRVGSVDA